MEHILVEYSPFSMSIYERIYHLKITHRLWAFQNHAVSIWVAPELFITLCDHSSMRDIRYASLSVYGSNTIKSFECHLLLNCIMHLWRSRVEYVCRVVYLWCTVCYCPCHLWRALPYSAAPTVCIRLAGSLPIECCARSHMGSLYSVSELRGSIYVIGLYNRTFFMLYIY